MLTRDLENPVSRASKVLVVAVMALTACSPPGFLRDLARGARSEGGAQSEYPAPDPPPESSGLFFGIVQETYSPGWDSVIENAHQPGSLIIDVIPGTPAEELGIEAGSILTHVDDVEIHNSSQVPVIFKTSSEPIHRVLIVTPDGASRDLEVTLRDSPVVEGELLELRKRRIEETDDPVAKYMLALGSSEEKEWIRLLDELIIEYPQFASAYELKALRLVQGQAGQSGADPEREQAARDLIATAAELDPDDPGIYATSARISFTLEDATGAENDAARAVELDKTLAEARNVLGLTQLELSRPAEALPHLHRAVALDPYEINFYDDLALCYRFLGQEDSAGKTIESAKTLTEDPALLSALDAILEQTLTSRESAGRSG